MGIGAGTAAHQPEVRAVLKDEVAGVEAEIAHAEACIDFWRREVAELEAQLADLSKNPADPGSHQEMRRDLAVGLLKRAAEAAQDARLDAHLARWRLHRLERILQDANDNAK
jgi:hypothetical protein